MPMPILMPMSMARLALLFCFVIVLGGCGNVADKYKRNQAAVPPPTTEPPPEEQELAAKIFSPSWARVGLEFELDGSGSTGGTPDQLAYAWILVSSPEGSTAAIAGPAQRVATFIPDLEGAYEFRLEVSRDNEVRNTSSMTTVVGPVSFVSRVQSGLVEWTDFNSNTLETIVLEHPVDLDRTLFMMTVRAERTNPRFARYSPTYEFIDNRTIEIRTGGSPNDPMYVAWTVVEFTPDAVTGVQRGTVDRGESEGDITDIALGSPVAPERAFVLPLLHQTAGNHALLLEHSFTARLTDDGGTLRLESAGRPEPGRTLSQWQVVEFTADSGVQVQALELDILPNDQFQRFTIEPVSLRNSFILSAGASVTFNNTTFPVRQAWQAYFVNPETVEVLKNINAATKSEYRIQLYVVSVAGAEVYSFGGLFPEGSAFPENQPSWSAIDRSRFDPVVMSGWNAFPFVWGSEESTLHTDLLYTVQLNSDADGVEVERGLVEGSRRPRTYNGFVVAWPRN